MRALSLIAIAAVLAGAHARGQETTNAPDSKATSPSTQLSEAADENGWSFSLSAATYVVPDSHDYVQPTFTADRGWLHLEARYNYEDLDTGSVWVGYNFSGGKKLAWEITPMLGGVFGDATGIAPGYKGSLSWWKLEFYSEGEYVFDTGNSADSFFYNWSELSVSPVDWFRVGLVGQRTRAYQSSVDIQRGLLVGFTYIRMDFTTYIFNIDKTKPAWVFSVGLSF